ncbi:MAG TPA: metallophosphoesterase [Armatimonadota bacterium]
MILAAVILWGLVAVLLGIALYGVLVEPFRLEVTRLQVPLPRLPEGLRGLVVGHISDLHLRDSRKSREIAEGAVAELVRQQPDLICISGDIINHAEWLAEGARVLSPLTAPLGVYLVLGNHDCDATMEDFLYGHAGWDAAEQRWREALAGTAITLLDNEWRALSWRGSPLVLAGIGDLCAGHDDLPRALAGAPEPGAHILLAHSPDALDLRGTDWADLVLAGHTHGGQLQLPGVGSVWAPVWRLRHRASGLLRLGHTILFVSRGVGSGLRARVNCPPQIALLELVPGGAESIPQTRRAPHPAWEAAAHETT